MYLVGSVIDCLSVRHAGELFVRALVGRAAQRVADSMRLPEPPAPSDGLTPAGWGSQPARGGPSSAIRQT